MDFPWIPLLFNLALLGVVMFVCRTLNASQGKPVWNGTLLFFIFCFVAMCLDFILTMVFASASFHDRTQYESVATRSAWSERFFVYLIPCIAALLLALRFRRAQQSAPDEEEVHAGRAASHEVDGEVRSLPLSPVHE
ncbi:hypothetical protein BVER_04323 [Candidatus Burkholderia verschuerenii]|uniref:Transmembrane protein n=1 Tax=Candidatus Burkholderia verschuerenii TaxID=242163 RepID=A0A0L0MGI9_9BURK|nr:hypothetical protein [Candidatus Burkholderia verschuerenii]KND61415.1 hypothetical protein BVER_04323 [Candidatus Burkholderia verschuerenii]